MMLEFSPQMVLLNPAGNPDCNCDVLRPVTPGSLATLPAPWLGFAIPLVDVSQ